MAERNGNLPPRQSVSPAAPTPTGSAPSGQNRPSSWPGSYYQNELGVLLPEPFPPPYPELGAPSLPRLQREYVAGGGWAWYGQVARTLPNAIDDVTADFGDDLYERMLFDPQVAAVTSVFKASILETGVTLTSAVRSRNDPDYEVAAEIADEAQRMIAEFDGSFDDVLWNMLDCVAFGNKVAEQTYKLARAQKDGRPILVLDKLKVRPRRATVFAVDIYLNLVGLLIRVPPNASPWSATMMFGPDDEPFNLLPPHKFVITAFRTKDNDPRGSSLLRPAYSPWWRKQQIMPEYLKYLAQFAGPSLIGYVGPEATPQPDPNNPGSFITAEQIMLGALQALRNGTAAAFPNGAQVDPLVMQGDGLAFLKSIDHCDQQITKAVLTQSLATEEGQHMARAAAQVHQDVLDTLVRQAKLGFSTQIRSQLFKRWVAYNWGDAATVLAPKMTFGTSLFREQPALWGAAAQLMGQGYLAPSQMQALDEQIGLPVRDETELVPSDPYGAEEDQPQQSSPARVLPGKNGNGKKPNGNGNGKKTNGNGNGHNGNGNSHPDGNGNGNPAPPSPSPTTPSTLAPTSPTHIPTPIQPGLPGMVGVRAHSRRPPRDRNAEAWARPGNTGTTPLPGGSRVPRDPRRRGQLFPISEPSSAHATNPSVSLPAPSAGAFG